MRLGSVKLAPSRVGEAPPKGPNAAILAQLTRGPPQLKACLKRFWRPPHPQEK
jgi:hypothetical protein